MKKNQSCMYGLAAEFEDSASLKEAAQKARDAGFKDVEAYTPYWVDGLAEIVGSKASVLPYIVVAALFTGAFLGFMLQYTTDVIDYPINVGGRPFNSWPAFMLVTFEVGILFAALSSLFWLLARTGLPLPYHPIFNTPNIEMASRSSFFLCIPVTDRQFNLQRTKEFLESLGPVAVSEVSC